MFESLPTPLSAASWRRRARMFFLLTEAREHYDFRAQFEGVPTPKAVARELAKIEKSLARIARFVKEANADAEVASEALRRLGRAGEDWAETQSERDCPRGFEVRTWGEPGAQVTDFGADMFLQQFFSSANAVHEIVRAARGTLKVKAPTSFAESAERWLIGTKLPEIFEQTFDQKFSINTWPREESAGQTACNEFTLQALATMRVSPASGAGVWSLETIKSHIYSAQGARPTKKDNAAP